MSTDQLVSYAAAPVVMGHAARPATSQPGNGDAAQRFDGLMQLLQRGRWQQAFTGLAELADTGHPQAARLALMFAKRGSSLFGGTYPANTTQRQRWMRAGD